MNPTLSTIQIFADGSGAPAIVECGDFRFAMDFLFSVRCNLIAGPGGTCNKRAAEAARSFYAAEIVRRTTPKWRAANKARQVRILR
jgi:hypothetical protein